MSNGTPATGLNTRRDTAVRWKWVSRGLILKLVAICLSALMLLSVSALAVANPQALLTSRVGYALGAGFFAALIFDLTGRSLCSVAPVTTPTHATIAASIGCQLAAIIVFVTTLVSIPELELLARILIGVILAGCAHALAAVFFVMFARNIAIHLGRDDLALSPISVLFLFGGGFSTSTIIIVVLFVLLLCPCMWWLIYIALAFLQKGWQEYGLPEALLWPMVRLVPVLCFGLLYFVPLYRYGRLLLQLRSAANQCARELTPQF